MPAPKRCTKKFLRENDADLVFEAQGTKAQMHQWQHKKILEYKAREEKRPPLNKSDW